MTNFKTTSIRFTSRAAVKIGDSFYTFESTIEKQCPETYTDDEYETAKVDLWNECHGEVDKQIESTLKFLQQKK